MLTYNTVLSIAGSDSGGGAGIQADIKTISALGGYAMSVITALTAQNTCGVQAVSSVSCHMVLQQLQSVLSDIHCDAIKIGMLGSQQIIRVVSDCLAQHHIKNVILDPVMLAKDGSRLLNQAAVSTLEMLMPQVCMITPNLPEAEYLLNVRIDTLADMQQAARVLCERYAVNVLLKGGHANLSDQMTDVLCLRDTGKIKLMQQPRIDTHNTHGTGCTLSAAIATYLAKGCDLVSAVARARHYLYRAIITGADYRLGCGYGPVNHQYRRGRI